MLDKSHIAFAALTLFAAQNAIRSNRNAKKLAQRFLESIETHEEERAMLIAKLMYLVSVLEKHDVPADEFDLIVLNFDT